MYPLLNNSDIRLGYFFSNSFLILGILNSKLLSPLNLWFKFILLGKVMSPLVMALIFFLWLPQQQ